MTYQDRFDLYPRKARGGKKIWYYRVYDEHGSRSSGKTTHQTRKTAARQFVINLIKKGALITKENPTFEEYARDWWIWEKCGYISRKLARGKIITRTYADTMRSYTVNHILPFFGPLRIQKITSAMVEDWLFGLMEKPGPRGNITAITANNVLRALKIMLSEAKKRGYLYEDPAANIEPLEEKPPKKGILSIEEVKLLFRENIIEKIWGGDLRHYTLNLTAAATGARMGELQALTIHHIHENFITIAYSWSRRYGLKSTKTNQVREVPIPKRVSSCLRELTSLSPFQDPEDLVFIQDRYIPIGNELISKRLYRAFSAIGISEEQRRERNITFHSWRYWFNSMLRTRVHDSKLQRLTGHKTEEMTDRQGQFRNCKIVKEHACASADLFLFSGEDGSQSQPRPPQGASYN